MIPFAGWMMPVQYTGIIDEHRAVRNRAGLFDLGHMGQVDVDGPDALAYLQAMTTNDVSTLGAGRGALLDAAERAGRRDRRHLHLPQSLTGDGYFVVHQCREPRQGRRLDAGAAERARRSRCDGRRHLGRTGMIAIQGPRAVEIVQRLTEADLSRRCAYSLELQATVAGVPPDARAHRLHRRGRLRVLLARSTASASCGTRCSPQARRRARADRPRRP